MESNLSIPSEFRFIDRGNWVEQTKVEYLRTFLKNNPDFKVIGVSSWFGGSRNSTQKIADFLDIEIFDIIDNTGGGDTRVESFTRWLLGKEVSKIIILDDQPNWGKFHESHVRPRFDGLGWLEIDQMQKLADK